jgi:hypothetical protein
MALVYSLLLVAAFMWLERVQQNWARAQRRLYAGRRIICPICNTKNTVGELRCESCGRNSVFMVRKDGPELHAACSTCLQQDTREERIVGGLCKTCGHPLAAAAAAAYGETAVVTRSGKPAT